MFITTKAFRIALTAAALCAAGTSDADARARRVVILDFDGPRGLADSGRNAVVQVLGEQYDVIATKRWEQARASVSKVVHGPQSWKKAAKQSGVDAVIEGWVQDEGRHKVLTIAVRDASSGNEIDQISVKLGKNGLTGSASAQLRTGLDEILDWIEGTSDPAGKGLPSVNAKEAREMLGAKNRLGDEAPRDDTDDRSTRRRARNDERDDSGETSRRRDDRDDGGETSRRRDDRDDGGETSRRRDDRDREPARDDDRDRPRDDDRERTDKTERRASTSIAATGDVESKSALEVIDMFGPKSVEATTIIGKPPTRVPTPTSRFLIFGGLYYGNRSFSPDGDPDAKDPAQGYSARSQGLQLGAAIYPFPTKKLDGTHSGVGFSFQLYKSAGAEVGIDTDTEVANYSLNQYGFEGAVHYRHQLGMVSLDGEVGYGSDTYLFPDDVPVEFEVPNAQYTHLHAGGHVDLHVTESSSIGFGGKYLYVLDNGDISSLDWYGPGAASGFTLDASFVIPLPKSLYIRGELAYRRITTDFDGAGIITEEATVISATDATMNGNVNLGIQF